MVNKRFVIDTKDGMLFVSMPEKREWVIDKYEGEYINDTFHYVEALNEIRM